MQQVALQAGDYVATKGMTEAEYHAVARAFMKAGAKRGEYPNTRYAFEANLECFGAKLPGFGLYHGDRAGSAFVGGRQLTIQQVLNATNAGNAAPPSPMNCRCVMKPIIKETDMQNWTPEVGEVVKHSTGEGIVMLPADACGVIIVMSTDSETEGEYKRVAAIACKPLPTEEDREVEEIARVLSDSYADVVDHVRPLSEFISPARALYQAGYRKQPQPTDDMNDPANWRPGDILECVADKVNLAAGSLYPVKRMMVKPLIDDDENDDVARPAEYFRFHSRP